MERFVLCAVATCGALAAPAWGQDPTREEIDSLREQVAELKETVAALKAGQQDPNDLSAARAAEIRAQVTSVLADAESRASLQAEGANAGWDKGFFLRSADGNFLLRIKGQLDFRWVLNNQNDAPAGNDTVYGFEMRRAKLIFQGHVVDPSWEYKVQGAFGRNGGAFILEDAYIQKAFDAVGLKFGQYKLPFLTEETMSSTRQLAVERSLVNEEFNQDFSKAVQVAWSGDQFRIAGAYSDGFGSRDSAFDANIYLVPTSAAPTSGNALTGRFDWLIQGDWKQFEQFTSPRGSDLAARVGLAVHFQDSKYSSAVEEEFFTWTLDGAVEGDGWNVFAYFVSKYLDSSDAAVGSPDQYGFVLQGGIYLSEKWEAFGRYEWGTLDIPGQQDLSIVTIGANWYISGQNLKWTNDFGVAFNEVGAGWSVSGTGWRIDAPGEDGQFVARSQFQLLF
jgi:hypothetical protein